MNELNQRVKLAVGAGEAAALFSVSRPTFLRWTHTPNFPRPLRVGGTVRFMVEDLTRWAEEQARQDGELDG